MTAISLIFDRRIRFVTRDSGMVIITGIEARSGSMVMRTAMWACNQIATYITPAAITVKSHFYITSTSSHYFIASPSSLFCFHSYIYICMSSNLAIPPARPYLFRFLREIKNMSPSNAMTGSAILGTQV